MLDNVVISGTVITKLTCPNSAKCVFKLVHSDQYEHKKWYDNKVKIEVWPDCVLGKKPYADIFREKNPLGQMVTVSGKGGWEFYQNEWHRLVKATSIDFLGYPSEYLEIMKVVMGKHGPKGFTYDFEKEEEAKSSGVLAY